MLPFVDEAAGEILLSNQRALDSVLISVLALQLCICCLSFACWHVENATKARAAELHAQCARMQGSYGQIHRCCVS